MFFTPLDAAHNRLDDNLSNPRHALRFALRLATIGIVLILVAWFGRDLAIHLPPIEKWIGDLGFWGPIVFIALVATCTMVFLPDTPFAIVGGVVFGLLWGTVLMTIAAFVNAALSFIVSRKFLTARVETLLKRFPKLAVIQHAASHQGLHFLLLLRLTPVSAVAVSHVLSAAGVRFLPFIVACVGLIPGLFVTVYLGYVASHVAKVAGGVHSASRTETAVKLGGLVLCVIVLAVVTRTARRELNEYDKTLGQSGMADPTAPDCR